MTDLQRAAQAVLDRWHSPQWEWAKQGPTADLIAELQRALVAETLAQTIDHEMMNYKHKESEAVPTPSEEPVVASRDRDATNAMLIALGHIVRGEDQETWYGYAECVDKARDALVAALKNQP